MDGALLRFINKINTDSRLCKSHVSIMMAILGIGEKINAPFHVSRREIMASSQVKSKVTYHKCIRDLQTFNYLIYNPSYHPGIRTTVTILANERVET